ncbi:MAG: hypothetical protein AAF487_12115 [Bacteroidota bacterium]
MKKIYCFVLLFIFSVSSLSAQDELGTQIEDVRKSLNQVDLNIIGLFRNGLSGGTFFFKKRIIPKNYVELNAIKLFRFRLHVNEYVETEEPSIAYEIGTSYYENQFSSSYISFGIEKQRSKRGLVEFYGIEATLGRRLDRVNRTWLNSFSLGAGNESYIQFNEKRKDRSTYISLSPFFGLKYFFNNRINMGVETSFDFAYYFDKDSFSLTEIESQNGVENTRNVSQLESKNNFLNFRFTNLRFLTVGYAF